MIFGALFASLITFVTGDFHKAFYWFSAAQITLAGAMLGG
jgi:hypothetical protein